MLDLDYLNLTTSNMTDFLLGQPSGDQLCREIALSLSNNIASVALQLGDAVDGSLKLSGRFETVDSTNKSAFDSLRISDSALNSDFFEWNPERTVFSARLVNNGKLIGIFAIALTEPLETSELQEFETLISGMISQVKLYLALRSPELIAAPREVVTAPVGRVQFLSDRQVRVINRHKEGAQKESIVQKIGLSASLIEEETVQIFKKLSPEDLKSVALRAIASGLIAI